MSREVGLKITKEKNESKTFKDPTCGVIIIGNDDKNRKRNLYCL